MRIAVYVMLITYICTFTKAINAMECSSYINTGDSSANNKQFNLDQALAYSRESSLELQLAQLKLAETEAIIEQEKAYQNPVLSLDADNFFGSNNYRDTQSTEWTLVLEQTFQWARKRDKQVELSQWLQKGAILNCRVKLREFEVLTSERFIEYQLATQLYGLSQRFSEISQELLEVTSKRVSLGSDAQLDLDKVKADLARIKIENLTAQQLVEEKVYALKSLWPSKNVDIPKVPNLSYDKNHYVVSDLPIDDISTIPVLKLEQHPRYQEAVAQSAASRVQLEHAYENRKPDITFSLGVKRLNETRDNALVAGISMPLPINNSQRNLVKAADARTQRTQLSQVQALKQLQQESEFAYTNWENSKRKLHVTESVLVPQTEQGYSKAVKAYKTGKYDLIDVLSARQTLFRSHLDLIRAQFETNMAEIKLRDLRSLPPFTSFKTDTTKYVSMGERQ